MVILDTNIVIDHLRQKTSDDTLLMKLVRANPGEDLAMSVISVQELYEGKSTRQTMEEEYLLETIRPFRLLPYNFEVAVIAGKIARDIERPIELADAAIAATAMIFDAKLFTLNIKDFKGISRLKTVELT